MNVYVGKTDLMQEILYKPSQIDGFTPLPPNVFHNLFPDIAFLGSNYDYEYKTGWTDWAKVVKFVEMDGRLLFKFSIKDWKKFIWGVNLNTLPFSLVGLLLRRFGGALTFACRYPNTIKNLDDAATVFDAINALARFKYRRDDYYEKEIARYRSKLKQMSDEIAKSNAQLENTCNGAADALNTLCEKFGLVVNV